MSDAPDLSVLAFTDEERAIAHAEEVRYWTARPNCHAGRHRLRGSLISHLCDVPPDAVDDS